MKSSGLQAVVYIMFGIIAGFLLNDCTGEKPEVVTRIETEIVTDTTYAYYKDKYKEDSLKWYSVSDSLDFFRKKYFKELKKENITLVHDSVFKDKPIEAPLRRYTGSSHHLYGSTTYNLLVAGAMLDIEMTNDFKIPKIKTTITNTVTNTVTKKSNGFYVTAGLEQSLTPNVGGVFVKDKLLVGYQYDFNQHSIFIGKKIF